MRTWWAVWAVAAATAVGAGACADADPEVDCDSEPGCVEVGEDVEVDVDHPADPATTSQGPIAIHYSVSGCHLAKPGACQAQKSCGHVHVVVPDCGVSAESHTGTAVLDLSQCAPGEYTIVVFLHDDRHAVFVHDGSPIAQTVVVTVEAKAHKAHKKHKKRKKQGDGHCG